STAQNISTVATASASLPASAAAVTASGVANRGDCPCKPHRIEYSGADGSTRKMEHVYSKVDGDTFQVKEYGGQSFELRRTLTFKRQKAPAATK
ncbi:MAG TPA: hypothetical protein PLS24_07550, partial [Sedimentisphaerales bacterium]|nr:hypothetical protein [Sedimentisphaerales bacterium]